MNNHYSAKDSHIPLPGTVNLRDLAGMPVSNGVLAAGKFLRGEVVVHTSPGDHAQVFDPEWKPRYQKLNIRQVIDLRNDDEVKLQPSAWADATGAEVRHHSLRYGGIAVERDLLSRLLSGELEKFDEAAMTDFLVELFDSRPIEMAGIAKSMADGGPVLIHCTAGKDRTGAVVAVMLSAIGASDEHIVADYQMTEVLRPNSALKHVDRFREAGADIEASAALFGSPAESMRAALTHLQQRYGDATRYLTEAGGLEHHDLVRLQQAFVTPN